MKNIKESEITWTQIDSNLRVRKIEGKVRIIENEGRRIYLDKKKSKRNKKIHVGYFQNLKK